MKMIRCSIEHVDADADAPSACLHGHHLKMHYRAEKPGGDPTLTAGYSLNESGEPWRH
eukprot:SAG11_NODE_853_length_6874_cov_1.980074_6_plen_58_part_00